MRATPTAIRSDFAEVDRPRRDRGRRDVAMALAAFALALLSASHGAAQETRTDHDARVAFDSGDVAFGEGRYDDALVDFRRAYDLSHRPELLYNIGLAADRLRHDEEAIEAFEAYLDALPDAANRADVQRRLRALHAAAAQAVDADVDDSILPPTSTPIYEEWWLWTAIGAAVALAIAIPVGIFAGSRTETEPFVTGDVGPGGIVIALEGR